MLKLFLPKEVSFFKFFEQHTALSIEATSEFNALAQNPAELTLRANRIKQIERKADDVTHSCINALHNTFITPIDRADIHRLMHRLDDIIDSVDSAASRMSLYKIAHFRPELTQLALVLVAATAQIDTAIRHLPRLNKESERINEACIEVYQAENDGDELLRTALVNLFNEEKDPVMVIKWKEIFERLERATDRCQEVANIISGIVIEAS
jgi:predicted phosphate transport protein (TIGR00153 family)